MTSKEKLEQIKDTLQKEGFTLHMKEHILQEDRLDCFWYEGVGKYATIENDRYAIEVGVYGELKYHFVDKERNIDLLSADSTDLWDYCIDTDKKLHDAWESDNDSYYLETIDNNWIEMPIYDKIEKRYITDTFDCCAIIPDTNNILEAIDGGMREYLDGFLSILEEGMEL